MPTLHERNTDLTLIIPVYNLEKFLMPMLDSLKRQDIGGYIVETIFVLNNCTDNSEAVIRESGLNCKIINCEIQGCGPARNAALEIATGEYIWFLDGDDWLLSECAISDVLTAMTVLDLDILRVPYESERYRWLYFSMVWQYVFSRKIIGDTRFPNYQPAEDDAFTEEVLAKVGATRWSYLQLPTATKPLYYYNYLRDGSNMFRVSVLGEKI